MPSNPLTDPNWAATLADSIERLVLTLRDKTTRPILLVLRLVIFGLVAAIGGAVALVLLIISLVRALQAVLDIWFDHVDSVWISYLLVGAVFSIVGLTVLTKRFPRSTDEAPV